jgi:hypothetical protein
MEAVTYDLREIWGRYALMENIIPVDLSEELMSFNLYRIVRTGTQSSARVPSK